MAHPRSNECSKSELDLFLAPNVQTAIDKGQIIDHFPVSNLSDTGPIEFNISESGDELVDMNPAWVYVLCKITKADGSDLADDDQVGPVNLFLHALFSQVDYSLNDKVVSSATNTNAFRAFFGTTLSYGSDAKNSQLRAQFFYKDTAGKMDANNPLATAATRNEGLYQRHQLTKKSAQVELMGPLHLDMFQQDRLLLNKVNVRVRLNRSKNAFCLVSPTDGADFKVNITEARLSVRKVKLTNVTFLGLTAALEKVPALYPICRVECKSISIPQGNRMFHQDDVFLGFIPKRLFIGFVENAAFAGDFKKNPFNFKHFKATQVGVYVNGEATPMKALQLNFEKKKYLEGYMSLFHGTGTLFHDVGNQITREDYDKGYTLYGFDLSPDLAVGPHVSPIKQGNLRVEAHFAEGLPTTVNCILYAEFDSLIEIDSNRNVTFNWN